MSQLTLERGQWYAWTMWPGYFGKPYHSPIRVEAVTPAGDRRFALKFLNLRYAVGVQNMTYELKTLRREQHYILAAVVDSERSVAIEPLNRDWFELHLPWACTESSRTSDESPDDVLARELWQKCSRGYAQKEL